MYALICKLIFIGIWYDFSKFWDEYVIFTKSSSEKDNENSFFKNNFLGQNISSKHLFAKQPLAVWLGQDY